MGKSNAQKPILMQKTEQKRFFKNVSILASGSVVSQAILFAVSPILTRLYTPEQFGNFQLFMSLSLLTGVLVTGKMELAIVLPKSEAEGRRVTQTSILLSLCASGVLLLLFQLFSPLLLKNVYFQNHPHWLYWIPLSNLLGGCISSVLLWIQRKEKYLKNTFVSIGQALLTTVLNIAIAYSSLQQEGLFWAFLLTQFILTIVLMSGEPLFEQFWDWTETRRILKQYIVFPKYMLWSEFLLTVNQQVVPIVFGFLYAPTTVGLFYLAIRILRVPTLVISNAVGNVFKNDAINTFRETNDFQPLYRATLKRMILLGIVPFSVLLLSAPLFFTFFFGEKWTVAGMYAQALSVMLFFEFITVPFLTVYIVTQKTKLNLFAQSINTVASLSGIFIGYFVFQDAYYSIVFFAGFNIIVYVLNLFLTFKLAKRE